MKKYLELLTHKIVFISPKTFIFFLIAVPSVPIIILLMDFSINRFINDIFYRYITSASIILSLILIPFFIRIIKNARKDAENFDYVKYINCSVKAYKFYNKKDKYKFYETILRTIKEKDLKYSTSKLYGNKYTPSQILVLKEVNEEKFKDEVLYELDFERFENEINNHKEKKWIREIFWYRYAFRTSIKIVLGKIPEKLTLEEVNQIKKAIINNINLSENGVELDKKGLKDSIDKITSNNLVNLKIPKAESINQKEDIIIEFMLKWFSSKNQKKDLKNLLRLNLSDIEPKSIISETSIKTDIGRIFFQLKEIGIYTDSDLRKIYNSNIICRKLGVSWLVLDDLKSHKSKIKDIYSKQDINIPFIIKDID